MFNSGGRSMKVTERSDEGLFRTLFLTPHMAATLTGLAVSGAATYYFSDTIPAAHSVLVAVSALSGFGVAFGIYHWQTARLVLVTDKSIAKLKKEHAEELA